VIKPLKSALPNGEVVPVSPSAQGRKTCWRITGRSVAPTVWRCSPIATAHHSTAKRGQKSAFPLQHRSYSRLVRPRSRCGHPAATAVSTTIWRCDLWSFLATVKPSWLAVPAVFTANRMAIPARLFHLTSSSLPLSGSHEAPRCHGFPTTEVVVHRLPFRQVSSSRKLHSAFTTNEHSVNNTMHVYVGVPSFIPESVDFMPFASLCRYRGRRLICKLHFPLTLSLTNTLFKQLLKHFVPLGFILLCLMTTAVILSLALKCRVAELIVFRSPTLIFSSKTLAAGIYS